MADEAPEGGPRLSGIGREHDQVFEALESALRSVRFPASKADLATRIGGVNVADERDLPLVRYLQALPDRRYASSREVLDTLNERWSDVRGLRGAGYGEFSEPS